jgi:hypothetical protein
MEIIRDKITLFAVYLLDFLLGFLVGIFLIFWTERHDYLKSCYVFQPYPFIIYLLAGTLGGFISILWTKGKTYIYLFHIKRILKARKGLD